ncbi:MAG: ankyrin repeat domain-containing protein [bacterium]
MQGLDVVVTGTKLSEFKIPTTLIKWTNKCFRELPDNSTAYKKFLEAKELFDVLEACRDKYKNSDFKNPEKWLDGKAPTNEFFPEVKFESSGAPPRIVQSWDCVQKLEVPAGSQNCFVGDIHGSLHALLRILWGLVADGILDDNFRIVKPNFYIVFLGDYVDRGKYGAEVLYTLCLLKLANWDQVFLLRGNHEYEGLWPRYGFDDELEYKFDSYYGKISLCITNLERCLPLALLLKSGKDESAVQCCHGGIKPDYVPKRLLNDKTKTFEKVSGHDSENINSMGELSWAGNFNWTDFFQTDYGKDGFSYLGGRGNQYYANGVKKYLEENGQGIKAFFRGHQHYKYGLKLPDDDSHWVEVIKDKASKKDNLLKIEEITKKVPPVFTFSTASGASDCKQPYDCYGILTTADGWAGWTLKVYEGLTPKEKENKFVKIDLKGAGIFTGGVQDTLLAAPDKEEPTSIKIAACWSDKPDQEPVGKTLLEKAKLVVQPVQQLVNPVLQQPEPVKLVVQPVQQIGVAPPKDIKDFEGTDVEDNTPLHKVAQIGRLDVVTYLVENKDDIKAKDKFGLTPLHKAAQNGHLGVVEYLVENKDDIKAITTVNYTPLHLAAQNGHLGVVEYLVGKGAGINAITTMKNTPLHLAAQNGHLGVVKFLIEKDADIKAKNNSGNTPLHKAVAKITDTGKDKGPASLDVVKYLVEKKANINAKNVQGVIPLHYAAGYGTLEVVEYLAGKSVEIDAKDGKGFTPLHYAATTGTLDVVKYLVEKKANINAKNREDSTPLHCAAKKGFLEIVEFLVKKGADITVKDKMGSTPLSCAADLNVPIEEKEKILSALMKNCNDLSLLFKAVFYGELKAVKFFVNEKKMDVNEKNQGKYTPLHLAAENGYLDIVKFLIEKGASINEKDNSGNTPLHKAVARITDTGKDKGPASLDVVKYLVDKGADINAKDNSGDTPLHLAAKNGDLDVVKFLIEKSATIEAENNKKRTPLFLAVKANKSEIVNFLTENGANVYAPDEDGLTPFLVALNQNKLPTIKLLVNKNNINKDIKDGYTPLHVAAFQGIDVVKYLVGNGAGINAKDNIDRTPLHCAAGYGTLDVVKYLVEKSADIDAKTKEDKTPLDYAKDENNNENLNYLVEEKKRRDLQARSVSLAKFKEELEKQEKEELEKLKKRKASIGDKIERDQIEIGKQPMSRIGVADVEKVGIEEPITIRKPLEQDTQKEVVIARVPFYNVAFADPVVENVKKLQAALEGLKAKLVNLSKSLALVRAKLGGK